GSTVKRPWLGARLQAVTPEIAEGLGIKRPSGALVASVAPAGPPARGGLQDGGPLIAIGWEGVRVAQGAAERFCYQGTRGSCTARRRAGRQGTGGQCRARGRPRGTARGTCHRFALAVPGCQGIQPLAGACRALAAGSLFARRSDR